MDITPSVFTIVVDDAGNGLDLIKRPIEGFKEEAATAKQLYNLLLYTASTLEGAGKALTYDSILFAGTVLNSPVLTEERKAELLGLYQTKNPGDTLRVARASEIPGYRVPGGVVISDSAPAVMPKIVTYFVDP